jgi:hypothetical protein
MKMQIADIVIGERCRKDMGDIAALAKSIEDVGLLHPPVVSKKGKRLVCGERRIAAAKLLGWKDVEVNLVENLDEAVRFARAEHDENAQRKDLLASEAVHQARRVKDAFKAEAKAAQEASRAKPGEKVGSKNGRSQGGEKFSSPKTPRQREKGRSASRTAATIGMSRPTLNKADAVVAAAEKDPKMFGPIAEEMDRTGKVDRAFKQMKKQEALGEVPLSAIAAPTTAGEAWMEVLVSTKRRIAGVRSKHCEAKDMPKGAMKSVMFVLDPLIEDFTEIREELQSGIAGTEPTGTGAEAAQKHEDIRLQGVGIIRANEAIDCLNWIPKNDALRKRGFQLVTDWIRRNR